MNRTVTLTLFGAIYAFAGTAIAGPPQNTADYREWDLIAEAAAKIQTYYVQPVAMSEISDNAVAGMLAGLDPHSSYMNPKHFAAMVVNTKHDSVGVGLQIKITGAGQAKVIAPLAGSPAERAGIKPGDYIAEIDGTVVQDLPLDTVIAMLQGVKGSICKLIVYRRGVEEPMEYSLAREEIVNDPVRWERKGDIGYISLNAMSEQASAEVEKAVRALKKGGAVKGYVLDLRNDPGGLLDQAVEVADAFLDEGKIVTTRGRHPGDEQRFDAHAGDVTDGKPLVVLINDGSAAGSEIVAAALQDHKRAIIIGSRSFGEGTIQTIIPLGGDRGALRLTTSLFYRPSGQPIQTAGVEPDINVSQTPKGAFAPAPVRSETALANHLTGGTLQAAGGIIYPDAASTDADFQLSFALDYLNRKK